MEPTLVAALLLGEVFISVCTLAMLVAAGAVPLLRLGRKEAVLFEKRTKNFYPSTLH